jgi:hypothetical protein
MDMQHNMQTCDRKGLWLFSSLTQQLCKAACSEQSHSDSQALKDTQLDADPVLQCGGVLRASTYILDTAAKILITVAPECRWCTEHGDVI